MKLHVIESNTVKLDGGSLFGNTPKSVWEKWLVPDELNRLQLACRCLLLTMDDGRNILFEAGSGPFFSPKLRERYGIQPTHDLIQSLEAVGVGENDLHAVVLSHLHFDHAGGLLSAYEDGPPRLLFPKAKYYVSREHWTHAVSPPIRERASYIPTLHSLLETSGRLVLIEGIEHQDLDFMRFYISHGHTKGLLLSRLELPAGPLVFVADLIPGLAWLHLPISMGYDRYAELLVEEKSRLVALLAQEQGALFFTHDPKIVSVNISRDTEGKYIGIPSELVT